MANANKRMKLKKKVQYEEYIESRLRPLREELEDEEKGDIKILVFTSNEYMHLTRIYAHLFNKFWSPKKKVTILGYDKPNFDLPNNFKYISLGKQEGGPENWSTPLRKYIKSLKCRHLIWSTEDLFIIDKVNMNIYNRLLSMMKKDNKIGRTGLTHDIDQTEEYMIIRKFQPERTYDIIQKGNDEKFRIGGIWSLWNRNYLLKYLKPGMTPWSFENQDDAKYDGYKILGTRGNWAISFCGSINSGPEFTDGDRTNFLEQPLDFNSFNEKGKRLDEKYILELRELGYIDENNVAIKP